MRLVLALVAVSLVNLHCGEESDPQPRSDLGKFYLPPVTPSQPGPTATATSGRVVPPGPSATTSGTTTAPFPIPLPPGSAEHEAP